MTASVGDILNATAAPVTGNPTPSRTWAWLRNSSVIAGQTATTYRVTDVDTGFAITARQTEANFSGSAEAFSNSLNVSAWSPSSLFAASEPGLWLDPSDVANLDWRRNLLTWTQEFDNAVWSKADVAITANAAVAPDGTLTAEKFYPTVSAGRMFQSVTASGPCVFSFYAKAGELSAVNIRAPNNGPAAIAYLDLTTGVVSGVNAGYGTATATPVGNGWYRFVFYLTASLTNISFAPCDAAGSTASTPSGTNGILIWGAQLELGSTVTDYQRITDVNTQVLERFPNTTMYQDRVGSTAVTTPGQSVGLRLDKSQGLVLGSELVTNGDFSSGANWTLGQGGGSSAISGGALTLSGGSAAFPNASQSVLTSGRTYRVVVVLSSTVSSGSLGLRVGGVATQYSSFTAAGTYTFTIISDGTDIRLIRNSGFTDTAVIDNISVKELPGSHAVANSDAARGIYGIEPFGGRRNLLTFTEQFDNASWTKQNCTILTNTATAPDGTSTADKIQETAVTAAFSVGVAPTMALSTTHTLSVYMKAAERSFGVLNIFTGAASCWTWYDLVSGTVGTVGSGATASISSVGNGWYRCVLTIATAASGSPNVAMWPATANNALTYAGTLGSGILIWGAQLETGSTATAYQRVTTQWDVTEAGVPTVYYVQYDGSDDGYVTPTINPGIDKVQVFTGVRKLSDAATGMLLELSASSSSNNGTMWMIAPLSSGVADANFTSKGTILAGATRTGFAAPVTAVMTGLGDISGDRVVLRINSAETVTTNDQGTGNYLAYPLYIGRRGGSSLPFNGRDYGIITRFGANLSSSNINRAEYYMAQKTGVTL
jgi:hypothetical protein